MLRVIGKRLSGYHNLQMVNFKIDLSDTVRLIADDTGSVRVISTRNSNRKTILSKK